MPLTIEELSPDLLDPPTSEHLFHYTDNHGFLGITDKKALWATDYQHLNDRSEYRHACNLVCEIAEERAAQELNPDVKTQLILIAKFTKEKERSTSSIGLISFSESRDQLSQWRAYGRDGGYAISFDFKALREIASAKKWLLVRCEYDTGNNAS